jgi:RND superfamily putative drug exporter
LRLLIGGSPRRVLVAIGLGLLILLGASFTVPDRLKVAGFTDPGSESARTYDTLRGVLGYDPEPGLIVIARADHDFRQAEHQAEVAELAATLARDPAVGKVDTAFGADGLPFLVTDDGRRTLLLVHFRSTDVDALAAPVERLREQARLPGAHVGIDGYAVGFLEVAHVARRDLIVADAIAIPVLALLLLLMFRGLAPAAVPLAIGLIAIVGALAGLRLLSNVTGISVFALNLGVLLGLGLATDYGLLLVSRFREEAARHGPGPEAVRATLATAGRTVVLSGCAIAGAFASLLLFPQQFISSMGLAGIFTALLATVAALAVGPPLLLLLGHRIGTAAEGGGPRWSRWTRWVMRRRGDAALATAALLVAVAAPVILLAPTFSDHRSLPEGNEVRTVIDEIGRHFPPYIGYPVNVAVELDGASTDVALVAVNRTPGTAGFRTIKDPTGRYAIAQLLPAEPAVSQTSQRLIGDLRALPGPILVGGRTAELVDLRRSIVRRAPLAIALAGLATLLVLFLLTGSILIPLKALAFNALGLAAVFGALVLIFQHDGQGIDLAAAVVIVAAVFGLATDYSIVLLARIVEEHEKGSPDEEAISEGIRRTGPVITAAALLICVPLLAQATSPILLVKQLGVGQTLGVALDATLIRMLLVPSSMRLLGRLNWWAPEPLRRARLFVRRRLS